MRNIAEKLNQMLVKAPSPVGGMGCEAYVSWIFSRNGIMSPPSPVRQNVGRWPERLNCENNSNFLKNGTYCKAPFVFLYPDLIGIAHFSQQHRRPLT
jgi:hypothetical protein